MPRDAITKAPAAIMLEPSLIFVTIARPQCAVRLIQSVRALFPTMPVIMVEQAEGEGELHSICEANSVERIVAPFDTGVSRCRNLALNRVRTDYVVIADDDFVFSEATRWHRALDFLMAHPDTAFIGGELDEGHQRGAEGVSGARNFAIDDTGRCLLLVPASGFPQSRIESDGLLLQFCDMVDQWGIGRTAVLREVLWDERFKTGGEHMDFFLRLKTHLPKSRVAYSPCFKAEHRHETNDIYHALRSRRDWAAAFGAKWGVECVLAAGGTLRFFDDFNSGIAIWPRNTAGRTERMTAVIERQRARIARQAEAIARRNEIIARLRSSRGAPFSATPRPIPAR